jgi:hypothetical protein
MLHARQFHSVFNALLCNTMAAWRCTTGAPAAPARIEASPANSHPAAAALRGRPNMPDSGANGVK